MNTQPLSTPWWQSTALAQKALNLSAKFWFLTVLVGQALFAYYIVMFYYMATADQDIQRFNQVMPSGHVPGDFWGNIAVIFHVLLAAIITVGGLLQLIPTLRKHWPKLHRWNGRLYVTTALMMSISGMFMVITRHGKIVGTFIGHSAIIINGIIIVTCAIQAFQFARKKNFSIHRIWALRLFVAVSGVWMFRIGIMAWLSIHGEPLGFDPVSFSGPFLTALYFTVYILPLFILEWYLRAQKSPSASFKLSASFMVTFIGCVFILGTFGATMGMWLPVINS